MRTFYLCLLLVSSLFIKGETLNAQTTNVDIGSGTTTTDNSPIQRNNDYSASELLYLSTEVNNSGTLTGLGFYKASGATTITIDSVYIYLKTTTATVLTTTSSTTGYTLVYRGPFPNTASSGWVTVAFNMVSGFAYNTTAGNLSVLLVRPYQALTTSRPYWNYTDNVGARNAWYKSNAAAWSGTMQEVSTWRPNIRLVFTSQCTGTPTAGSTTAAVSSITCNNTTTLGLSGSSSGLGINYQWQYNTSNTWVNFGTNSTTQTTPAITQTTQFRCIVSCTYSALSQTSTPVTVTVNPIPVNIGNDTTICPGISYTLNAGNAGATYLWNTGATTQSIATNAVGVYHVTVTNTLGCKGSDTLIITPGISPVATLPSSTNLCENDTVLLNANNNGCTYLWSPTAQTSQTIQTSTAALYKVTITSSTGCKITDSTLVSARPLPVAQLNDTAICQGTSITLNAGNAGYSFQWNNGAVTQTINIADSGLYTVNITSPYNCLLKDTAYISYLPAARTEGFNFIPLFNEALGKVQFYPLNPTNVDTYTWDFGDGSPISNLQNPTHTFALNEHFIVTLTVANSCGDYLKSLPITISPTGINDIKELERNISIYPNPAKGFVHITTKDLGNKIEGVSIYDIRGNQLFQAKDLKTQTYSCQTAFLSNGIYLMEIKTGNGVLYKKIVVNN